MMRRIAVILLLVVVATACGSSGQPTGFEQQLVPIADDLKSALGTDADALPVVERNFLEGCVLAEQPSIEGTRNLGSACQCAYDEIVAFYRENTTGVTPEDAERAAFDAFKELDKSLKDEENLMPADIQRILDGCAG